MTYLDFIVQAQKYGEARGLASICSAHPWVLRAAMRQAAPTSLPILIESTCNQVNQFGGYTGMTPAAFVRYVGELADDAGLPRDRLLLGGDHLGPNVWQNEPAASAMQKSAEMVRAYVQAGYTKIHLDASMKLADDAPDRPLDVEISAERAAFLAQVAEEAGGQGSAALRYVIGTEVPVPGGAREPEEGVPVTTVASAQETLAAARRAFQRQGIAAAWERVLAVVVQPGVEFGDDFVFEYRPEKARGLAAFIAGQPRLAYEAHSTDYQPPKALRRLVEDHFAILKVGPALTFAFREAAFALARLEQEWLENQPGVELSRLPEMLEQVMLADDHNWRNYYRGDARKLRLARRYSYSDRSRYYWNHPAVQAALERLLANLSAAPVPAPLLSQFLPEQHSRVQRGCLPAHPAAWIEDKIAAVLAGYAAACGEATAGCP
jgi:D-tagatose-1,6-bisphosphate aldolase subunit GatZ/KbaZ